MSLDLVKTMFAQTIRNRQLEDEQLLDLVDRDLITLDEAQRRLNIQRVIDTPIPNSTLPKGERVMSCEGQDGSQVEVKSLRSRLEDVINQVSRTNNVIDQLRSTMEGHEVPEHRDKYTEITSIPSPQKAPVLGLVQELEKASNTLEENAKYLAGILQ